MSYIGLATNEGTVWHKSNKPTIEDLKEYKKKNKGWRLEDSLVSLRKTNCGLLVLRVEFDKLPLDAKICPNCGK